MIKKQSPHTLSLHTAPALLRHIAPTLLRRIVPTLQRGNSSSNAPALRDTERHKRHSHLCPFGCAGAWQRCNQNQSLGFTLIELLIVLTLIGMISGVAAPNFWALFTKTMEQQDLDKFSEKLETLRQEAWTTGRSIQLPQGGGKKWPSLPTGWQAEKLPALRFLATGLTNGGQLILSSRSDHRWQIDIRTLDGKTTLTQLAAAKAHE